MDEKSGRVVWFDCARYLFFVSLLCFEWNCFSFSLACFLLLLVRSWFLWNFVNYRSSWHHYEREKKCPCLFLLLVPRVDFPALGLKMVSAWSLSDLAQWVFELKQTNKQTGETQGKQSADPPAVSLDLRGNESTKHLHRCPSPICSHQLYMPNIPLTLTERTHLSSQALINPPFDHFPHMYWESNLIWSFKSPANNDVGCICVWEYCFIRKKPTLPFVVLKSKPIKL